MTGIYLPVYFARPEPIRPILTMITSFLRLRNEGRINDFVLRRIERELDLNESILVRSEEE